MFEIAAVIDYGGRQYNDDRLYTGRAVLSEGQISNRADDDVWTGVCDGVGGAAFGDEAAQIVAEWMASAQPTDKVEDLLASAHQRVAESRRKDRAHSRMATTIAGLFVHDTNVTVFNIGDSRVYRFRGQNTVQLSQDHTVVAELRAQGIEPRLDQYHVITRVLGGANPTPFIDTCELEDSDIFMVCSDGISDVLLPQDISGVLGTDAALAEKCQKLIEAATKYGSTDNMSVILARKRTDNH